MQKYAYCMMRVYFHSSVGKLSPSWETEGESLQAKESSQIIAAAAAVVN